MHGTARAVARFSAGLLAGGVLDGVRLFREESVREALRPQAVGRDMLLERDVAGLGLLRSGRAVGYGYVTAAMGSHERAEACEAALEDALAAMA